MTYPLVRELAEDGIPVSVTCRVLKFSSQGYYQWLKTPCSKRDYDNAHLTNALAALSDGGGGSGGGLQPMPLAPNEVAAIESAKELAAQLTTGACACAPRAAPHCGARPSTLWLGETVELYTQPLPD